GSYVLTILDDAGCRIDKNIAVDQSPDVTVEFLGDVSIIEGQSVLLQAEITGTHLQPEKNIYTWTPSHGLDCSDCREPMASPSETTEYVLQVQNAFGCWDEDTIMVEVKPALLVFIPKAFSPNGDGVNDILYIFTKNEDVKI